ncbi:MAG: flagellar biosynthesis anti-sigma factor FlgM [Pseudomonadota bacterium]
MKVDSNDGAIPPRSQADGLRDANRSRPGSGVPGSAGEAADSVSLSASAQIASAVTVTISAQPEVDEARVAEIRSAIENGTYHVDPDKLASQFLELENIINQ